MARNGDLENYDTTIKNVLNRMNEEVTNCLQTVNTLPYFTKGAEGE